ncbi:bifunctional folylpolyglutamate synthase/dihydrofolate synthase [Deltaproteobacteria bacterium Smac51]|nr:bifunctional folylpolyglutamate synthase/dihydrofolate synthase [Deltaproteobacteria bacterium Smac51]
MSYKTEVQKLFDLQKFGMKFGLDNMRGILAKLGNPQDSLRLVHLAGTNGKGSVGSMLSSVLHEAGFRVGLYTSPHLITFRERIRIGHDLISEEDVLKLIEKVEAASDPDSPPTFFEFVTAMAFLYFKEQRVDIAIIEAGLGGRLDSTNVIAPLATVITNISLEHTEHLGDTIEKIASEKAGIIKSGAVVITGGLVPEAAKVVEDAALEKNCPLYMLGRDFSAETTGADERGRPIFNFKMGMIELKDLTPALSGPHQTENASIVVALMPFLAERGFPAKEKQLREGLTKAFWPGRAELLPAGTWPPDGPKAKAPLLLDGAHNPAGAAALAKTLDTIKRKKLHLLVGVMADKDIAGVLGPIYQAADRLYLTRPAFSRAATPELLLEKVKTAFGEPKVPVSLHPALAEAFAAAAASAEEDDLVVLSGSLFTVGEGRAYLNGINEVESN